MTLPRAIDDPDGTVVSSAGSAGDDAEWVRRAREGDRAAEELLYKAHVARVTRAVTRLLGRVAEADDVIQDTFVRALEHLDRLDDGAMFGPWVRRIAVSLCMRRFRRQRLLRSLGLASGADATLESLAAPAIAADRRLELRAADQALACVQPEARTAWILHQVEGWTIEETAAALSVSLATAKRRIAEATSAIDGVVRRAREESR